MPAVIEPTVVDDFRSSAERKKRLGQYFTGVRLARLLAALAGAHEASSVIDPMVGTGDMLIGCLEHGAKPAILGGVEIDPIAQATCVRRLKEAGAKRTHVLLASAFSLKTLQQLPTTTWDVCITNPPYVRYQSVSRSVGEAPRLPSAVEIRDGLVASIDGMDALEPADKRLFRALATGYSGLADLAVPCWILCAGLVKVGGTLAMLVPTTWLNRDYAHPVQYLLARWFDTRFVVEDADAAWFPDALVRTTLVIARRVDRRHSAFEPRRLSGYVYLKLGRPLADERSVVGALFPKERDPDLAFALEAERWHAQRCVPKEACVSGHWLPARDGASRLSHGAKADGWLSVVEPTRAVEKTTAVIVPPPVAAAVGDVADDAYLTVEEVGWRVGQGLRTGANQFFYAESARRRSGYETLRTSVAFGAREIAAPTDAVKPVLRRQADLPAGLTITTGELSGRVLVLDAYALEEDVAKSPGHHRRLPESLASHVRKAAELNIGTDDEPKIIPELSAVAPNARSFDPARPEVEPRFWYQLPALTDRHQPELVLARVNHTHPKTYVNEGRDAIIDANFSSLWPESATAIDQFALLALLNSSWTVAAMELNCTVLGGGALKVEAAHLRRLPLPRLSKATEAKLGELGQRLAGTRAGASRPVLAKIDALVIEELVTASRRDEALQRVRKLAAERLSARSR